MKTRTVRSFAGSLDHRLETLEARTVLSAEAAAPAAPSFSNTQVLVADEAFLSAASDPAGDASAPSADNDADMYDFGGARGARAPAASHAASAVNLDDGAVDQMGNRPFPRTSPPADAAAGIPIQWAAPADYSPMPAEVGPQADSPETPAIENDAPAPVANAPETPATVAADQTPVIIATANAAPADTAFVWIESTDSWLLTTKAKAAEQVVIQSTFVAH